MDNVLESYLIKLGATTDTASFTKFHNTLKDAGSLVESFTSGAVHGFVKLETSIVSTFSAFGVGLVSLADKTAMADQQFGLMGSRMLMTKNSFRAMQSATDALGVSLNDIVTDTTGELNKEFQDLYERNLKLGKQLGSGFESSMVGIRHLRVEFKQFETELEFLSAGVIGKLFEKLGFGSGDVLDQLRKFNDWFSDNLPQMANDVSAYLVPVWKDMVFVLKETGQFAKLAGVEFTNIVADLSGDNSIRTTTLDLDKLAKAFVHVADAAASTIALIKPTGGVLEHFMNFHQHVQTELYDLIYKPGNVNAAIAEDKAADAEWKAMKSDYSGLMDPSKRTGEDFNDWNNWQAARKESEKEEPAGVYSQKGQTVLRDLIRAVSSKYGLDPALLAAVIKQESNGDSGARSPKGAEGLMQLMPGTARDYGVANRSDPVQSVGGGAHYLSDLLRQYGGDTRSALSAYNEGPAAFNRGSMPAETRSYVDDIMRMQQRGETSGGDVIIQSMTITVPPGSSENRMRDIIADSMKNLLAKRDRNVMAQTAAGPHF
jgi:hypothetical protein